MARITDVERGARIAWEIAAERLVQPELFDDGVPASMWDAIENAALAQIAECNALRAVQ